MDFEGKTARSRAGAKWSVLPRSNYPAPGDQFRLAATGSVIGPRQITEGGCVPASSPVERTCTVLRVAAHAGSETCRSTSIHLSAGIEPHRVVPQQFALALVGHLPGSDPPR